MKYKGDTFNMWDAWYMNVNGRVHGFHLKEQPGNWSVGHIVTDDLLHFTPCPDILPPLSEETHPDDCLGKYTGCAYYDEETGKAYVYYTMRDRRAAEKIGVAISEDFIHFPIYEGNPVLTVDPALLMTDSRPAGGADCRDMLVVFDEKTSRYYGYFAAMATVDGRMVGVIAAAVSDDLLSWTNQTIVYVPKFAGVLEVPDVFYMDGKWYLTYLTGNIYGAKGAISDPNPVRYTLCASADTPLGPFWDEEDNLLLCGGFESGYSCRSVEWGGKRYGLYIDRSCYGAAISLPKEFRVVNGSLKFCYTDILQQLRTGRVLTAPTAADFEQQSTSFAWNTYGGHIQDEANGIVITTEPYSYQRYVASGFSSHTLEAELTVSANCRECGLVISTADQHGAQKETYVISLHMEQQELIVYADHAFRSEYTLHSKRHYPFDKNGCYHVRVIAGEGQFEVYIDDVLALQGNMCTNSALTPGLFCACGTAGFSAIHFYEWEE